MRNKLLAGRHDGRVQSRPGWFDDCRRLMSCVMPKSVVVFVRLCYSCTFFSCVYDTFSEPTKHTHTHTHTQTGRHVTMFVVSIPSVPDYSPFISSRACHFWCTLTSNDHVTHIRVSQLAWDPRYESLRVARQTFSRADTNVDHVFGGHAQSILIYFDINTTYSLAHT